MLPVRSWSTSNTPPTKVLPFGSADWQLHPRLHPGEGDLVVHKQHGNAFEDTSLHAELTARGIGRVIVTGLVTHGCVKATCEGALALGYAVVLAADGHSSYSKDAARLIEEWNRKLGEAGAQVMPAAEIGVEGHAEVNSQDLSRANRMTDMVLRSLTAANCAGLNIFLDLL